VYAVTALLPLLDGLVHDSWTPLGVAGTAVRFVGAPGTAAVATLTDAFPWIAPTAAVSVPLPAPVPAVKVVLEPVDGSAVPSDAGLTVQVALEMPTGLPYASAPPALKDWLPPGATVAEPGETAMVASGPAVTVSPCVPLVEPLELAVKVGVAAFVSS
jgi:hypothetical protein